jgi:hypothetical protein
MTDEITELKAQLADALKRLAALETVGNRGYGIGTSEEASLAQGRRGTAQLAMDRAELPRHVTDGMVKATAGMVPEIVRTAKAR